MQLEDKTLMSRGWDTVVYFNVKTDFVNESTTDVTVDYCTVQNLYE